MSDLIDQIAKSVTFICSANTAAPSPVGTAFLVSVPFERSGSNRVHIYLVTAAHMGRPLDCGPGAVARLSLKAGGVVDIPVGPWEFHDTHDVAVGTVHPDENTHDFKCIPFSAFVGRGPDRPQFGDRVFFPGLLSQISAMADSRIPMLRAGTVGALYQPDVPVMLGSNKVHLTGHLVDCQSYEGFSGSPCFFQRDEIRRATGQMGGRQLQGIAFGKLTLLLGLVSAHFSSWEEGFLRQADGAAVNVRLNAGIAVITPAESIAEVLNAPTIVAGRSQVESKQI